MNVTETKLPGVLVVEPRLYGDSRGHFYESWNAARYSDSGIPAQFVQDNVSFSSRGVLRGLHIQHPYSQGKLVSVLRGEVFDVAVDVRRDSPTRGEWMGIVLSGENGRQLYLPPGFAHGFQVLSADALFLYKCTEYYRPENEATIAWDDPEIGVEWPLSSPVLSPKDASGLRLRDLPIERQPSIEG